MSTMHKTGSGRRQVRHNALCYSNSTVEGVPAQKRGGGRAQGPRTEQSGGKMESQI